MAAEPFKAGCRSHVLPTTLAEAVVKIDDMTARWCRFLDGSKW
jgi:hypothetical protein